MLDLTLNQLNSNGFTTLPSTAIGCLNDRHQLTTQVSDTVFNWISNCSNSSIASSCSLKHLRHGLDADDCRLTNTPYRGLSYTDAIDYSDNAEFSSASSLTLAAGYFDRTYGYGLVNAAAAVAQALGLTNFPEFPYSDDSWSNQMINAPDVWVQGYSGQNVVVAVVDSGVDYTHPDLSNNIWRNTHEVFNGIDDDRNGFIDDIIGWDFSDLDNNPMDGNGHGTHVAGTIAATNDGFGITGVAYNAQIMPVRVLGDDGSGSNAGVAAGIRYATDNGAKVINLSLGGSYSSEVEQAVRYATARGAIVVMAAGNDSELAPGFPANMATDYGLAVGAIDWWGEMAYFSNLAGLDSRMNYVVAPGVSIYSTLPYGEYGGLDGTSMAAPHISGVAALMLSANPMLTPTQIRQIITQTTFTDY